MCIEVFDESTSLEVQNNFIDFCLNQNYPNPFNPTTTIKLTIANTANTEIVIYNIKGQTVNALVNDRFDAGTYQVMWNGKDENGKSVTSGIYFYQLKAGKDFSQTKRMILIK